MGKSPIIIMKNQAKVNPEEFNNSKGARMLNIKFDSGNNDVEQNTKEAFAHAINRLEKKRHLGENFNDEIDTQNLNRMVDSAQHYAYLSALIAEEIDTYGK